MTVKILLKGNYLKEDPFIFVAATLEREFLEVISRRINKSNPEFLTLEEVMESFGIDINDLEDGGDSDE